MKNKITVTHEGWMSFCPIWMNEDTMDVWPKYKLALVLEFVVYLQIAFGWIYSLFGGTAVFAMKVRKLPPWKQFEMEIGPREAKQ